MTPKSTCVLNQTEEQTASNWKPHCIRWASELHGFFCRTQKILDEKWGALHIRRKWHATLPKVNHCTTESEPHGFLFFYILMLFTCVDQVCVPEGLAEWTTRCERVDYIILFLLGEEGKTHGQEKWTATRCWMHFLLNKIIYRVPEKQHNSSPIL